MISLTNVHTISSILKVNRGFRDLIRLSLRVQHKLDLYATGLVPNWATGVTIADSIKALEEYRSRWDCFYLDGHKTTVRLPPGPSKEFTAGGVYGVATEHQILLFTLPSNLRAIQPKSQTISLDFKVVGFAFHPQADVVVVAGQTDRDIM
jgi:hypothetical protein